MYGNFLRDYILPFKCEQSFVIRVTTVFFTKSDRNETSVAILAEISENARNLKLIADGNFRTIGHEIMAKNARNFTFGQKEPEIARNLAKLAKIMPILTCLSFMIFQFFFVHKDPEFEFYFLQYFSLQFQRLA